MENLPLSPIVIGIAVLVGAVALFFIIRKLVKVIVSLVIVAVLAAIILFFLVKGGYVSDDTAEKLNPLTSEAVKGAARNAAAWAEGKAKDAGRWAGGKAKDAAKEAVKETFAAP